MHGRTGRNANIEYEKDHFPYCLHVSIWSNLACDRNELVCSLLTIPGAGKEFDPYSSDLRIFLVTFELNRSAAVHIKDVFRPP